MRLGYLSAHTKGVAVSLAAALLDIAHALAGVLQAHFAVLFREGAVHHALRRIEHLELPVSFGRVENQEPRQRGKYRHACLLVLALAGCKHVSELQVASNASAATAAQTETHEVKSAGPEHIVLTVEEYEQLCPSKGGDAPEPDESMAAASDQRKQRGSVIQGVGAPVSPGPLIRRTVTVTDRGPSLDDLRSLSSLQSKVNTALEVKEEKKSGPAGLLGLLGSLWPAVLIGGAILAGFVVWRAKPPWLSFLFKLLGRTP